MTHAFWKAARRSGLNGLGFHDLFITHASLIPSEEVSPKVVSQRLEHSDIATTGDIYSHVAPGLQQEAAVQPNENSTFSEGLIDKLGEDLFRGGKGTFRAEEWSR